MTKKMFAILIITVLVVGIAVTLAVEKPAVPIEQIRPLYDHLLEAPKNWKDAYGDTLEARLIYNLAVLRNNQLEIAKMIQKMHPPVDPNEVKEGKD